MRTPLALLATAALAATSLVALGGVAQASGAKKPATTTPTYYVSVGDSYSVGYQPGVGATTGYAGYVTKTTHLTLANFGCAGATTTSIIDTVGCPDVLPHTAGDHLYPTTTQAAAAEAFITAHRGHIGLITASIGGNDVTDCLAQASLLKCAATAVIDIDTNVTTLADGLRSAAGPKVPIIGLTYPDVILGSYVYPSQPVTASRLALAATSVVAFKSIINPVLSKAYASAGASFVDVTAATGAYTPLTKTVTVAPYGTIPRAVARVCTLTWYCAVGNIHATNSGYALIGQSVVARLATLQRK